MSVSNINNPPTCRICHRPLAYNRVLQRTCADTPLVMLLASRRSSIIFESMSSLLAGHLDDELILSKWPRIHCSFEECVYQMLGAAANPQNSDALYYYIVCDPTAQKRDPKDRIAAGVFYVMRKVGTQLTIKDVGYGARQSSNVLVARTIEDADAYVTTLARAVYLSQLMVDELDCETENS